MREKFSKRIQTIIKKSREEAVRMGHSYVGSEHLLLGLLSEKSGFSNKIFDFYNINLDHTIKMIEDLINTSKSTVTLGHLPLTRRAERIIKNAYHEASSKGFSTADDEHLLLAFLREPDGIAHDILDSFSFSYESINEMITSDSFNFKEKSFSKNKESKSKTPTLDHFSRDLTYLSLRGDLDPVIGRESEIERVIQILSRRKKSNPILIGEPGVGKTAIVEGLATKIIKKSVPRNLYNKRILSLDLALIVSGTKYRGQFEERIKSILEEVRKNKNVITFIDEIHTIIGAGSSSGSMDASNMIKPALARGEIFCIGATTIDEYKNSIEYDGALERRFQKLLVDEPTLDQSVSILHGLKSKYEKFHRVKYSDDAIKACVELSERYISDRNLPDKAIDILDEVGARVQLSNQKVPKIISEIEKSIFRLKKEKEQRVREQLFEQAAIIRDKEKKMTAKLDMQNKKWEEKEQKKVKNIGADDIAHTISIITEIPISKLKKSQKNKLTKLNNRLKKEIVGQDDAINALVKSVQLEKLGFNNPNQPVGIFLFLGPTGVGKTELAKVFAKHVYIKKDSIIKVDMSEFSEQFTISRLIGSPPGYIGYDRGGELTEKIRRNPHSLILLDEIEKAHPSLFNIFLQVFDEGILTDSSGKKVNFKNSIIIMTSNLGTDKFSNKNYGFINSDNNKVYSNLKQNIREKVEKVFPIEFINRIDDKIIFNSLSKKDVYKIIDIRIQKLNNTLKKHNLLVILNRGAKNLIANKGYSSKYGVRHLTRTIKDQIENKITNLFMSGHLEQNSTIKVCLKDSNLDFKILKYNDLKPA